jgi:hypothetical protein
LLLGLTFVGLIGLATATRSEENTPSTSDNSRILLKIDVEPTHAVLYLDNQPLPNPLPTKYRADGALHEIRVEAAGYLPRTLSVKFETDVLVVVALGRK